MKVMFSKVLYAEMEKAFGKRDLSKLRKEIITDKNGHRKTVYKKIDKHEQSKGNGKAEQKGDRKVGYRGKVGDHISFTVKDSYGTQHLEGDVVGIGVDGVTVSGTGKSKGIQYRVRNDNIVKTIRNSDGTIPATSFNANDYKKTFTDPNCTNDAKGIEYVYSLLGADGRKTQAMVEKKLNEQTHRMKNGDTQIRNMHNIVFDEKGKFKSGEWNDERKKLHEAIFAKVFTPEIIAACMPKNGEKKKFVMFGGRGGSGKSWFTDKNRAKTEGREVMFNGITAVPERKKNEKGEKVEVERKFDISANNFLILDADAIKEEIPEYKGWNAGEVHEESSYLMKEIKKRAMNMGLNIIIDGTMNYNPKKPDKVRNEMLEAKDKGYSIEAHYMFAPIQKSCVNAMQRFKTKNGDFSGRLVPTDILLSMQDNEKSFDSVKDIVDDWSFRDNQDFKAKLVSQKGK